MNVRVMCQDHCAVCPCMCHEAVSLQPMVSASRSATRYTPKTGEMRNMKQNPVAEHWKQCGSSNVSLVPLRISPWDVRGLGPSLVGPLVSSLLLALGERKSQAEKARPAVEVSQM